MARSADGQKMYNDYAWELAELMKLPEEEHPHYVPWDLLSWKEHAAWNQLAEQYLERED